ncbi:MAG: capsular biosynthesis protein [Brevundimonas sp.]
MIIFPMAGESSRFRRAGYSEHKYMLPLNGRYVFDYAVAGFLKNFANEHFRFVHQPSLTSGEFIRARLEALGIGSFDIMPIQDPTRGQAETVRIGLRDVEESTPLTIFNIDTFRSNIQLYEARADSCGELEVFDGEGDNWSFVLESESEIGVVVETAEKRPISRLCCTGLYRFANADVFKDAFAQEESLPKSQWQSKELYVAPLYNHIIRRGLRVEYYKIDREQVVFCGVPDEYEDLLKDPSGLPIVDL